MARAELKNVMQRAHEIAREKLEGDYMARMSLALKMAWAEVKREIVIRRLEEALKEHEGGRFNHSYELNRWTKYGHDRLYINRTNGRNSKSKGYIDLKEMTLGTFKAGGDVEYTVKKALKGMVA